MPQERSRETYQVILTAMLILAQCALVFLLQIRTVINSDGIFSYTLSNNPYCYNFIDANYDTFPNDNGWINAHILKENYVVESYDRFNYSAVYLHQRFDVHPPLYYFIVHTLSSLQPGRFSVLYTMLVNLAALLLADVLLVQLFRLLYGRTEYALVPILLMTLMGSMKFLFVWARMYMLLFLFCTWYFYLHVRLVKAACWRKRYLAALIGCIVLGSLTHYYFYVYAALVSGLFVIYLIAAKKRYALCHYLYSGVIGLALSWIVYPWVMWHIFGNAQEKHAETTRWSVAAFKRYLEYGNDLFLNGRGVWFLVVPAAAGILALFVRREKPALGQDAAKKFCMIAAAVSGLLYSVLIFTLDEGGGLLYYWTPAYLAAVVAVSMALIGVLKKALGGGLPSVLVVMAALLCITVMYSPDTVRSYLGNARNTLPRLARHETLRDGFYRVSEDYRGYDCIYIEKERDSLLHNYFFEFGEYAGFKILPLDDFVRDGISRETLSGRKNPEQDVIIYAPQECVLEGAAYQRLASDSSYHIYRLAAGGAE